MSDIFISYSTQDRDRAKNVATRLMQEGWSVFWNRNISPGSTWDDILEKELYAAKVIVVLWSNNSVRSEWVRIEAANGASRNMLVPALLEKVKVPMRFQLIQAADISDWESNRSDTEGMSMLIEAVASIGNLKIQPKIRASRMPITEIALKWKKEQFILFLSNELTQKEFDAFCLFHFFQVYQKFTDNQTKREKIDMLVSYVTLTEKYNELYDLCNQFFTVKFSYYGPYYE
jgi:hypothetical protein